MALSACQKSATTGSATLPPASLLDVTVAYTTQPQSTLVHVALAQGYFAAEGLNARPTVHKYGKTALQAVLEHQADFATVAETPIMFSVLAGEKIYVLANIEASAQNNGIVANADAGIRTPKDLKGKRIGYTAGTTSDFFLDSFLTANALQRADIHAVALTPDDMRAAMAHRAVDAVSTWNYTLSQIASDLGRHGVVFYDHQIYTETFNLVAQQDFVQLHPVAVQRFLRALIKAEKYVAEHPAQAQDMVSAATQVDPALVRQVWDKFNYRVQHGPTLVLTLEDETRWAISHHLTQRTDMPDYQNYLYADSLRSLKPDAVSALR